MTEELASDQGNLSLISLNGTLSLLLVIALAV
jgi:hypothetical protein